MGNSVVKSQVIVTRKKKERDESERDLFVNKYAEVS